MSETLMSKVPQTDFEIRLFLEAYVRELKVMAGKDAAYIDELRADLETLTSLTADQRREFRREQAYTHLVEENHRLSALNRSLRHKVDSMTVELIRLRDEPGS